MVNSLPASVRLGRLSFHSRRGIGAAFCLLLCLQLLSLSGEWSKLQLFRSSEHQVSTINKLPVFVKKRRAFGAVVHSTLDPVFLSVLIVFRTGNVTAFCNGNRTEALRRDLLQSMIRNRRVEVLLIGSRPSLANGCEQVCGSALAPVVVRCLVPSILDDPVASDSDLVKWGSRHIDPMATYSLFLSEDTSWVHWGAVAALLEALDVVPGTVAVQGQINCGTPHGSAFNCGYESSYGSLNGDPSQLIAPIPHSQCRSSSSRSGFRHSPILYLQGFPVLLRSDVHRMAWNRSRLSLSPISSKLPMGAPMPLLQRCTAAFRNAAKDLGIFLRALEEIKQSLDPVSNLRSRLSYAETMAINFRYYLPIWEARLLDAIPKLLFPSSSGSGFPNTSAAPSTRLKWDDARIASLINESAQDSLFPMRRSWPTKELLEAGDQFFTILHQCHFTAGLSRKGAEAVAPDEQRLWWDLSDVIVEATIAVANSGDRSRGLTGMTVLHQPLNQEAFYRPQCPLSAAHYLDSGASRSPVASPSLDLAAPDLTHRTAGRFWVKAHVVWDFVCCRCCGASEGVGGFVRGLYRLTNVHLRATPDCFCDSTSALYRQLHVTEEQLSLLTLPDRLTGIAPRWWLTSLPREPFIWVEHQQPHQWRSPRLLKCPLPDIIVGRLGAEFGAVELEWKSAVEEHLDEVWVPSEFSRKAFVDAGVPENMVAIIPESVDTHFFSPDRFRDNKLPLPDGIYQYYHWCNRPIEPNRSTYKFFSNFQWEQRKGWVYLLEAYWEEFRYESPETVSLYILTQNVGCDPSDQFCRINIRKIVQELERWALSKEWVPQLFPHICVVADRLSAEALAQLMGSADAFVLASRAESWGRVTLEAMSMALPVIATNWSGNTVFLNSDVGYPLPVKEVVGLDLISPYGWHPLKRWATPSTTHLKRLMRLLVTSPKKGKQIGQKARLHVQHHFSEIVVGRLAAEQLEKLTTKFHSGELRKRPRPRRCLD